MKFVVTRHAHNETEVKLHWETKEKIKNFFYTVGWIAGCSVIVLSITKKKKEDPA